jgi:hypothetical protein
MHKRKMGECKEHELAPNVCQDVKVFLLACENPASIRDDSDKERKARSACESKRGRNYAASE